MSYTGKVVLIGGGPGAWDLITVRGMRALQAADVILTDHLGPTSELDKLCDVEAKEVIDVAKLPYSRQVSQEKTNELLVEHAQAGKTVARLKGGDPFVFGRGFEEVQACAAAGVACEVIPGVTSAVSVPAAIGVPVTQRGVVHAFTVVSGHVAPDHPNSLVDWRALAASGATLCVIMGVRNVAAIAAELQAGGLAADTPAAVIQEGTTHQQRGFRCTLGTLAETFESNAVGSPAVYVIGEVAGL
jgi:uroporphyrin-III C-methyltransferase